MSSKTNGRTPNPEGRELAQPHPSNTEQLDEALFDLVVCGMPRDCAWVGDKLISPARKRGMTEDRAKQYEEARAKVSHQIATHTAEAVRAARIDELTHIPCKRYENKYVIDRVDIDSRLAQLNNEKGDV